MESTRKAAFTWDALGRRIEHVNDVLAGTTRYYYDGVNEIVEDNGSNTRQRYYVHGVSYIDERLMMFRDSDSRPFYYVVDRMNNVRMLIDRAGAIVERYAYDAYGRPRIRESCGRGDMDNSTRMDSTDSKLFADAKNSSIWDPRADMDDDGDVDSADQTLYNAKYPIWNSLFTFPTVAQAFSDVDNPFMFQGVPHFAVDTNVAETEDRLSLNHHRARIEDCASGWWCTRDPLTYNVFELVGHGLNLSLLTKFQLQRQFIVNFTNSYDTLGANPSVFLDSSGLHTCDCTKPSGQRGGVQTIGSCNLGDMKCQSKTCSYSVTWKGVFLNGGSSGCVGVTGKCVRQVSVTIQVDCDGLCDAVGLNPGPPALIITTGFTGTINPCCCPIGGSPSSVTYTAPVTCL